MHCIVDKMGRKKLTTQELIQKYDQILVKEGLPSQKSLGYVVHKQIFDPSNKYTLTDDVIKKIQNILLNQRITKTHELVLKCFLEGFSLNDTLEEFAKEKTRPVPSRSGVRRIIRHYLELE